MSYQRITMSDVARAMLKAMHFTPEKLVEEMGITINAARHILRSSDELRAGRFLKICEITGINPGTYQMQTEIANTALSKEITVSKEQSKDEIIDETIELFEQLTVEERYFMLAFCIIIKRMGVQKEKSVA